MRLSFKGLKKLITNNCFKILIVGFIIICLVNGFKTSIPPGISLNIPPKSISSIEFLYDLTYIKDGVKVHDQEIFSNQLQMIDNASKFIILDLFLFNADYNRKFNYPNTSELLTNALIDKKKSNPNIEILFITDPINNFYGVYENKNISRLKDYSIDVVITDLEKLRDPNPIYSGLWRTVFKWFGISDKGWLPNPFSPDSPKVNIRGYLSLLNLKANHRKVIITDNGAMVTSGNPHDSSSYHSNVAFKVQGEIVKDLIISELNVAKFSGYEANKFQYTYEFKGKNEDTRVGLVTEGKIKESILEEIDNTDPGDKISMGMFYLAHREVVNALINAANKGVNVKLILDPNKDAFGITKKGIPNRQVAAEILEETNNKAKIRWYDTHGEQYHTKFIFIETDNTSTIIGGSGNFTRKNIEDYNLETDLKIVTKNSSKLSNEVENYFNRIWNNLDGYYTTDYNTYEDNSKLKILIYRFQEWSGLSSF